jgi:hypothetical protein
MGLRERLQAEAQTRAQQLASRGSPTLCIACGTTGPGALLAAAFRWRKQVGRSAEHHVRVEHVSVHPICPACLADVRRRRRTFWLLRYLGGFALAAGLCGVIAVPILLLIMNLAPAERRQMTGVGWASAAPLLLGLATLALARRLSVPKSLLDMTDHGWECVTVEDSSPAPAQPT